MPKANRLQASFAGGEISPRLRGRVDTQKFSTAVETAENMLITPQGAAVRRPGSKHLGAVKSGSSARLYPFRFSNTDTYILEFGIGYVRIWRNEAALNASAAQYAASAVTSTPPNNTFADITTAAHAYNGQSVTVYLSGFVGTHEFNGLLCSATGTSGTTFRVITPHKNAYTSGGFVDVLGSTPIEVVTPYTANDLEHLYFEQSADILYICHSDYQTRKLARTSGITWALSTMDQIDGPYLPVDTRAITMTLSNVVDAATLVSTATPFIAADVNEYVEFQDREVWQLAKITTFTSTSQVTVDIIGNTLVDLDPNVRLTAKASGTARSVTDTTFNGAVVPNNALGAFRSLRRPTAPPAGYTSQYQGTTLAREGIDPGSSITYAAGPPETYTSSFRNTFSRYDVGKYVRQPRTSETWRLITGFVSDTVVEVDPAVTFMVATPGANTLSIVPGSRTITGTLTASSAVFLASDVGRHVRLNYNSIWVWGKITGYTSTTVVTVTLYDEPPTDPQDNTKVIDNGRTVVWRLGSWSNTTGWPRTVAFHEQRLVFGGSKTEPHTLWFSRSADFENHSPTEPDSSVLDDNGIAFTLASNEVNSISWLKSGTVLLIGTVGGEWQARAATSVSEPITPTNISITPQTNYGSVDYARPVKIGSSVLFIQRSGRKIIELSYSFELDAWQGRDLNVAADHIAGDYTMEELAWCAEPYNLLFVRLSNGGGLACCTYNRDQEVLAWHKHTFADVNFFDSICASTAPDNSSTRLYMAPGRLLTRYLERISFDDTRYADSYEDVALTGVTEITSVPTRFQPITPATLDVNASTYSHVGAYSSADIVGNVLDLGLESDIDYYGFAYNSHLKLLPSEGGSTFGTAMNKIARPARVGARVYDSASIYHGTSAAGMLEVTFTSTPFTGDAVWTSEAEYSLESGMYFIGQNKSLPLTILLWAPQVTVNE